MLNLKGLIFILTFKKGSTFNYFDKKEDKEYVGLKAYDTNNKSWKHLNFFEHECYLHARVPRVKLENGKVKQIQTPWEGLSNGFTLSFEAFLVQLCQAMPVNKVASITKTSDDKLWSMLEKYIDKTREHEYFKEITSIGLDETSRAKGHEYITLFVDLQTRRTIFITEGKDNTTVKRFVEDFEVHNAKVDTIENVSCDMSPAFIKGVKERV